MPIRFEIDVTTPGLVRMRLNSVAGIHEARIDGAAVPVRDVIDADLASGRHAVTLVVDPKVRTEGIRCELEDAAGSPAKAQPVVGK